MTARLARPAALALALAPLAVGCTKRAPEPTPGPSDAAAVQPEGGEASPVDSGGDADADLADAEEMPADSSASSCPRDMVLVDGRFCVDRYEAILVDDPSGQPLSPYYPPIPGTPQKMFELWQGKRAEMGPPEAHEMPLPLVPAVEKQKLFLPRAVVQKGALPQGFVSGKVAGEACQRARKRLCTHEEWVTACRGERRTRFPYGDEYREGQCNVYRSSHPAMLLHGNASIGHSDPRLAMVKAQDGALLRAAGQTRTCASRWGDDAIYDMVGNVDEWIDDPDGTFVGGFYSRTTRNGCDAVVTAHPLLYWDYSLGVRCCR